MKALTGAGDVHTSASDVALATGVGEWPGTDIAAACSMIAGELPDLPFLPDLPDRGVGADLLGRALAVLVDLPAEVGPAGWRLTSRPGRDAQRAADLLAWDLDAVQESFAGAPAVKVQLLGPWSIAARLELRTGHKVLADHGAVAEVAQSLTEGVGTLLDGLRARLPGSRLVLQVDEPEYAAVVDARVPTASGFGTLRAVPVEHAVRRLRDYLAAIDVAGASTVLTGIEPSRWPQLRDLTTRLGCATDDFRTAASMDAIGEVIGAGGLLQVTVDPRTGARATFDTLTTGWHRIGYRSEQLAPSVVIACDTPPNAAAAPAALRMARELAAALTDPPESWR